MALQIIFYTNLIYQKGKDLTPKKTVINITLFIVFYDNFLNKAWVVHQFMLTRLLLNSFVQVPLTELIVNQILTGA